MEKQHNFDSCRCHIPLERENEKDKDKGRERERESKKLILPKCKKEYNKNGKKNSIKY
ncbi:MAG: hypothetical protein KTM48_01780 [Wolbachia endosymbiont of Pissodes strobi]|nr:hypothetical protein [Wolbachia endosymbiont of Pissodes strobi]